ncbi:Hypothetical predicted protein [Octopus vulgaris]|uniref:Helitron helicase-like domain-containing protein n=1 Tax=Octopus vulgaris TaxID=6645 RepID=A0AA36AXV3_OCTVU|nr:Hypothetical predicted protein [Octopus vulgaris]
MQCRRFLQQYAVDQWAKVERSRLQWVERNQTTIKAEEYSGLLDDIHQNDSVTPGRRIILPPTIKGSPRFYNEAFQSAMGKPNYFIAFTTNPKWPEIQSTLFPEDRSDILARVFKMKLDALLDDLLKKHVLGKVITHTPTTEWQKRGLTHAHILLIMAPQYKPAVPEVIDKVVSAEIPDKNKSPQLFKAVMAHNIHGPCGSTNKSSPCVWKLVRMEHIVQRISRSRSSIQPSSRKTATPRI